MAKKKTVAEDREAPVEEDMTDEDLEEELAAEDLADEEAATDTEMAAETAETEAAANENMVMLTADDVPEGADMDIGDSLNATVELTLRKKNDDGTMDFQVTDVISPQQEAEMGAEEEEATTPGAPPPPNLAGALGGAPGGALPPGGPLG